MPLAALKLFIEIFDFVAVLSCNTLNVACGIETALPFSAGLFL
jgi:hypothetical protein